MNRLEVQLIGNFEIRGSSPVQSTDKRKASAILAFLLLNGQARETRARIAALLWSERDEKRARDSLRQCVRDLKAIESDGGVPFLQVDKLTIGIDLHAFQTDIADVDNLLASGDFDTLDRLLSRAGQGLCTGLEECDPVFDNWLRMNATQWTDRIIGRLSSRFDDGSTTPAERKGIAGCILHLDPYFEAAIAEMLRALHREGGYAKALAYFERFTEDLRRDLDIDPSPELDSLMEELSTAPRAGARQDDDPALASQAKAALQRLEMPTIVILTSKQSTQNAHIEFALVSELSASLSRFRHWTALRAEVDIEAIRGIDMAAIRKAAGDRADLAVLISPPGDRPEAPFDISCYDIAKGQLQFSTIASPNPSSWRALFNDICARVAARLQLAISSTRLHRIAETSPNYVSAYDSWLDGQRLSILWRTDTEDAAIARYEEAIRRDPQLACAYSSLAAVLNSRWIVLPGYPVDSADLQHAFELAKTAVTLDPLDHRNQVNLAWSHLLAGRWDLADFHFSLAHDLNASNPSTLIAYALASGFIGNHDRARELAGRAFELNPRQEPHYHGYNATVAFLAGDLRGCIESVARSDGLFPDIRGWSAAAHALMGNDTRAASDFRDFLRRISGAWYNGVRPDRQMAIEWFKGVFPIRRPEDRQRLHDGIDQAARLAG